MKMTTITKKCIVGTFALLLLTSCATVQSYSYSEYRTNEPTQGVHAVPVIADLEIAPTRITYAERININITSLTQAELQPIVDAQKETVLFNAIKQQNADIIVAPLIDIQTDSNNRLIITVVGYPATYKNFRNATKDDAWFIPVQKPAQENQATKKDSPFKLFKK